MSRAWGEHDIEERTWVYFLFLRFSLVFSRTGAAFRARQGAAKAGVYYSVLAQGSSPGNCGKRDVYPVGQGHPCILGPPALGLCQAGRSRHPGATKPQTVPKVSHARCGATATVTLESL